MKVQTKRLKQMYPSVKDLDPTSLEDGEPLFWCVHPEIDRQEPVAAWQDFFDEIREKDVKVVLSLSQLISEELEDYLSDFEAQGRVYTGGFEGEGLSYLHRRQFPDHDHYLLGWRIDDCVNAQVDYLVEWGIPNKRITILEDYSFSGRDQSTVEQAVEDYQERGIQVESGSISDLFP